MGEPANFQARWHGRSGGSAPPARPGHTAGHVRAGLDREVDAPGSHHDCPTRDDVLAAQLREVVRSDDRCTALRGVLDPDPYAGKTIAYARGRGAAWPAPLNLIAVDGPANVGKSDDGASLWLPPRTTFHCVYVVRQIGGQEALPPMDHCTRTRSHGAGPVGLPHPTTAPVLAPGGLRSTAR